MSIFIDTSGFIAVLDMDDANHTGAARSLAEYFDIRGDPRDNQLCSCGNLRSRAKPFGDGSGKSVSRRYCSCSPD
jgi:CDGSH-type Zn-finger protein